MVSLTPRPMRPEEDTYVRDLHALCHPEELAPAPFWYFAHPTLVLEAAHRLIGYASFTLSPMPKKGYVAYGADLGVHPEDRGKGYGRLLHEARCRIARDLGALDFVGTTTPDNTPMIRIFAASGLRHTTSALGRDFYIGRV